MVFKMKKKGWYKESRRHALAAKGVRTGRKGTKTIDDFKRERMENYYPVTSGFGSIKPEDLNQDGSLKRVPEGVARSINTVAGKAYYETTEVEDEHGNWNQRYATRDGYWVIHDGKKHHVYKV